MVANARFDVRILRTRQKTENLEMRSRTSFISVQYCSSNMGYRAAIGMWLSEYPLE